MLVFETDTTRYYFIIELFDSYITANRFLNNFAILIIIVLKFIAVSNDKIGQIPKLADSSRGSQVEPALTPRPVEHNWAQRTVST